VLPSFILKEECFAVVPLSVSRVDLLLFMAV